MSNVTITSKNQVTLPKSFIQRLKLGNRRILQIEVRDGSIILTPQPTLSTTMTQFWGKHHAAHSVSDEEIRQAARAIASKRAA